MNHSISPPHREKNGRKKREQSSEVQSAFLEAGRFYDAESGDRVGPMHTLTGRRFWARVSGDNPSPEWDATGAVLNGDVFPNPFGRLVALSEIQRTLPSKEPAISPPHRYPSGDRIEEIRQPRKETEEQLLSVAFFQRGRLGATMKDVRDAIWTRDPLYMMRRWSLIANTDSEGLSRIQFEALKLFMAARGKAHWAQGFKPAFPVCVMWDVAFGGFSMSDPLDDERVIELRREYNGARSLLLEYAGRGVEWCRLLDSLSMSEKAGADHEGYWRRMLPEVRSAANVLVRHYGLDRRG